MTGMTATNSEAEGVGSTKQRLLEAAEELFAQEGFERVSVRDITARAGANVAAVNYHFGNRMGLVHAVVARHVEPVIRERLVRLGELERRGGMTVEELAEAYMRPFVTQVRRSELAERMFGKLMGRLFGEGGDVLPEGVVRGFAEVAERFARAFAKAVPGVAEEEWYWRQNFMAGAMVHTLAHAEMLQRVTRGRCGDPGIERVLSRCVRFVAAGMREGGAGEAGLPRSGPQGEFLF